MKVTELRIGNYAKNLFGIIQIEEIPLKSNPLYNPDAIEPIPLTEEWLLRFRFRTVDDRYYNLSVNSLFVMSWNIYEMRLILNGFFMPNHQYVHQLQNLYFALTGEELNP